jgi:hypothetical protein
VAPAEDAATIAKRRASLEAANRRMFEAECRRAGVSAAGRVASPELERLVRGRE